MTQSIEVVTNPNTSWEHRDIYQVEFDDLTDEDQQADMLGCSDFHTTAERAADGRHTYDPISCCDSDCDVKVKCVPPLGKMFVKGICPYLPEN